LGKIVVLFGPAHIGTQKTSTRPTKKRKEKKALSQRRKCRQANLHIPRLAHQAFSHFVKNKNLMAEQSHPNKTEIAGKGGE
jgi:flagellar biosynthesis/type III secretory pathway chaperone